MSIYIGSARIGENGKITGGKDGDQKQVATTNDLKGEVSSQLFYKHKLGWDILRPIKITDANKIAKENKYACDNKNVGYNQYERYDIVNLAKNVKSLKDIVVKCNSDCSSLTRAEIITACKKDVGDFTTASCKAALTRSGLFEYVGQFVSQEKTPVYDGDILCTLVKGHVVTVNSGNPRPLKENTKTNSKYYPACDKKYVSIVDALISIKVDPSLESRKKIAIKNGYTDYSGGNVENTALLNLLKKGKLLRV